MHLFNFILLATAATSTPTAAVAPAFVPGKAFDRLAIIYLENQDYDKAYGDASLKWLRQKGLTLSNFFATTHPSMPNYMASIAGDYFGMDDDEDEDMIAPSNVATIVDLLESKGISWGLYQEDMPYTGFTGNEYLGKHGRNMYVRKHNPAVLHKSITESSDRLAYVKNLSMTDTHRSEFHKDLSANTLPQWMFITPNMTSDGHDTTVKVAGKWTRGFLEPLLRNPNFTKNTLVLVTFDETDAYEGKNHVLAVLVGDAIPSDLVGKTDDNFYNHYSEISTVSANWDLPTLGRWDVGANVFKLVADKTGDKIRAWESQSEFKSYLWNGSYSGYFNSHGRNKEIPKPNLNLDNPRNGRPILQSIKEKWAHSDAPTYYEDSIKVADDRHPPSGYKP